MQKQTYVLKGHIKAETPLAVSRPGDNFRYPGQSEAIQRLPRSGPKHPDSEVFFPASTLNGAIRRSAVAVVRRALAEHLGTETPLDLDTVYMLTQGVDTGQKLIAESKNGGLIEEEQQLRDANPLLSLLGRWGLPGHLGMGDAFIDYERSPETVTYLTGTGARTNDWARNADAIQYISKEDRTRLKKILVDDAIAAKDANALKDKLTALKKELRAVKADKAEHTRVSAEIEEVKSEIESVQSSKAGAKESIQRPLDGYEVIARGVVMNQKTVLTQVTPLELGLFIHALAEFSREPLVGAHTRQGAGLISGHWEVLTRPVGSWKPIKVGEISMSFDEFDAVDTETDGPLSEAIKAATAALSDPTGQGLDFTRCAKILSESTTENET